MNMRTWPLDVHRRQNVDHRGEACHILDAGVRNLLVSGGNGGCRLQQNFLRIHEGNAHQSQRRAENGCGNAILLGAEGIAAIDIKRRKSKPEADRMGARCFRPS